MTTFKIERADDASGTNATTVATTIDYTVQAGDLNKYLRLGVMVQDKNGTFADDFGYSNWTQVTA